MAARAGWELNRTVVDLACGKSGDSSAWCGDEEQIEQSIGEVDVRTAAAENLQSASSPGQQAVHYSPVTPDLSIQ